MEYEELSEFIIHKMRPNKSYGEEKNYQPVVIRLLNQSENGFAKEEEILDNLKKENQDREISSGMLKTVTDTLLKHKIIGQKNNGFVLLGYETFNPAHKAEITKRCEDRIDGNEKSYFVLDNEEELTNAQKLFLENLRKHTTKQDKIIMGFPGPAKNEEAKVDYIEKAKLWWYSKNLPDHSIPRFYNCFGDILQI